MWLLISTPNHLNFDEYSGTSFKAVESDEVVTWTIENQCQRQYLRRRGLGGACSTWWESTPTMMWWSNVIDLPLACPEERSRWILQKCVVGAGRFSEGSLRLVICIHLPWQCRQTYGFCACQTNFGCDIPKSSKIGIELRRAKRETKRETRREAALKTAKASLGWQWIHSYAYASRCHSNSGYRMLQFCTVLGDTVGSWIVLFWAEGLGCVSIGL